MKKVCKICGKLKNLSEYHKSNTNKDGRKNKCKQCVSIESSSYYKLNRIISLRNRKLNRINNPIREIAQAVIDSHKRKGYIVIITKEELINKINEINKCAICNKTLSKVYGRGKIFDDSLSIDRINNEKELRNDNIQVVCHNCNVTKQNRTMEEFVNYCKVIYLKFGDKN